MKRSRRSLTLLLAVMAASLAVVRVSTQPATERGRVGREEGPAAASSRVSSFTPADVAEVAGRSLPLDPFVGGARAGGWRPRDEVQATPGTTRPVSATAVILVIPGPGEFPAPRLGWSGCRAYAVGCDHLGRRVPGDEDEAIAGALSARRF